MKGGHPEEIHPSGQLRDFANEKRKNPMDIICFYCHQKEYMKKDCEKMLQQTFNRVKVQLIGRNSPDNCNVSLSNFEGPEPESNCASSLTTEI